MSLLLKHGVIDGMKVGENNFHMLSGGLDEMAILLRSLRPQVRVLSGASKGLWKLFPPTLIQTSGMRL